MKSQAALRSLAPAPDGERSAAMRLLQFCSKLFLGIAAATDGGGNG